MRCNAFLTGVAIIVSTLTGCKDDEDSMMSTGSTPRDPNTAARVPVDRFSASAGMLFVRDQSNGLPGPNQPVDFDQGPFITRGLGPSGQLVTYYNFDVQSTSPANIYVLFRQGDSTPVSSQLNIVDVVPGTAGYNDFWRVVKVTVPATYVANTITSAAAVASSGFTMEPTPTLVNCPIVPEGSTGTRRIGGGTAGLHRGWYRDQVVFYFTFEEHPLMVTGSNMVPVSPIYVTFNINPGLPGGGPPSGFMTESTGRTHNVVATIPSMTGYSPLWSVNIYDNADFPSVSNLATAQAATQLVAGAAIVNCPVVEVQ